MSRFPNWHYRIARYRAGVRRSGHGVLLTVAVIMPAVAAAQGNGPPVRSLGPLVATSPVAFASVSQLVPLADGRVLVADGVNRVVRVLDASLANPKVVLDSAPGRQNSFSARSFLTNFTGDSALFLDGAASAFVVLDAKGTLGRVWAAPPPLLGVPFVSPTHGLVFKASFQQAMPARPAPGQPDIDVRLVDSVMVERMNLVTRAVDTLAQISTGHTTLRRLSTNSMNVSFNTALFPFYDDVVVTTDGSVAIFHAREYRIEWIGVDGKGTSGPRLAYPWRRLTDDDGQHVLDSVNAIRQHEYDSVVAKRAADSLRTGSVPMTTVTSISADGERTTRPVPAPPPRLPAFATPAEVPDFRPPTNAPGTVLADGDNHVWICPTLTQPIPGFSVWEVIDRQGALIDRVRVPENRTIAGFGPGVIYLVAKDAGVATLEKVRITP